MNRKNTFCLLLFFLPFLAIAQETGHFQFGGLGGVQSPVLFSKQYGNEKIRAGIRGAYNFHVSYLFPWKKFNAEMRLSWGETMFQTKVNFSTAAHDHHPYYSQYENYEIKNASFDTPYYEAAFFLGKPFKATRLKTSPWDFRLGVGIRKRSTYYTYGFAAINDSMGNIVSRTIELPMFYRRFIPVTSIGVTRMFKFKYDFTFSLGAEASVCLINSAKGTYILVPGQPEESGGVMKLNGGYLGVRLGFGIPTHWKKKEAETKGEIKLSDRNPIHLIPWYDSWFVGVSSFAVFPAKKISSDPLRISFNTSPGISLTAGRRFKVGNRLAISPRIGFSAQSFSYLIKEDSAHLSELSSDHFYLDRTEVFNRKSFTSEILFETPLISKKWFRLVGDIGAGLRMYGKKKYSHLSNFDTIPYGFEFTQEAQQKISPFFSAGIYGEWPGRLGNLQVGAEFSYSPNYPLTGTYTYFAGTSMSQTGSYKMSGTMAGVKIGYLFRIKPAPEDKEETQK